MATTRIISLSLALGLFCVFFGNVLAGGARWGEFMGDITQVIVLFLACVAFVVGILVAEAEARMSEAK